MVTQSFVGLARTLRQQGKADEAVPLYERAVAVRRLTQRALEAQPIRGVDPKTMAALNQRHIEQIDAELAKVRTPQVTSRRRRRARR